MYRLRVRRASDSGAAYDAVAECAERLSSLLSAGVSPAAAWSYLAESKRIPENSDRVARGQPDRVAQRWQSDLYEEAAAAAAVGASVADAVVEASDRGDLFARTSWRVLAAAWAVAEESGAPLAGCLRELAVAARDNALLVREVRVALAGPLASARLVTALPLVAVMFGLTLGFDTLGVLTSNPLGVGCLGAGVLLLWLGYRWNHALARRASRDDGNPALEHDLLAIALSSGVSIARAQQLVHRTASRLGLTIVSDASIGQVLSLAAGAGAPVADLLRSESARLRRAARIAGQERAAKLGVGLMAPLGLCVLPAFIVLGIAPLLMSVVTSTLRGS